MIFGPKYVERTERALCETAILEELRRSGPLPTEVIEERVKSIGAWDEKVDSAFITDCLNRLDSDGHVLREGATWAITEDGRDDVEKMEAALCCVTASEVEGVTVPPSYAPAVVLYEIIATER